MSDNRTPVYPSKQWRRMTRRLARKMEMCHITQKINELSRLACDAPHPSVAKDALRAEIQIYKDQKEELNGPPVYWSSSCSSYSSPNGKT